MLVSYEPGSLREAVPFYERSIAGEEVQDLQGDSITYRNLADLHASLGALDESAAAARQSIDLALRAERRQEASLAQFGRTSHLSGDIKIADTSFQEAESFTKEDEPYKQIFDCMKTLPHLLDLGCQLS
jgi:hypothetical protein